MKKNKMIRNLSLSLLIIAGLGSWMACNKGFDRMLADKDYTDTTSSVAKEQKVLYIIIDGARGQSVRDANPPHIMSLTGHAIYCWNTVTDTLTNGLTSWADLLTGVHKEKHRVLGYDVSQSDLKDYPVIFKYIRERKPGFRIAALSSSDSLGENLITDASVNQSFGEDDAKVQAAALSELKVDSAGLVLVQYSGVDNAGAQYGYDISVPEYKASILQTDTYIGALLDAIQQRKDYAAENWLVVVTSSHGGPFTIPPGQDDHTILSNPKVNGFTIFYAPGYQPSFIDKPYTGNRYSGKGVELYGSDSTAVNAIVPDDNHDYDIGANIDFTVELKIKVMPGPNGDYKYTYPSVLSKRKTFNDGQVGWCIFLEQKFWQINFGQVGQGNKQVSGADISDGTWHDIAAVIVTRGGKRYARTYTDGNFNRETEITDKGNLNTDAPLTMGFLPGSVNTPADVYITDLRMWQTALSDATIGQFACETSLPADHPNKDKLIGYWPCVDGQGGIFKDQSTILHDFKLQGDYQWDDFSDLICPISPANIAQLMPQPVDIPRQILNWLRIAPDSKWALDGRVWTTNYTSVEN